MSVVTHLRRIELSFLQTDVLMHLTQHRTPPRRQTLTTLVGPAGKRSFIRANKIKHLGQRRSPLQGSPVAGVCSPCHVQSCRWTLLRLMVLQGRDRKTLQSAGRGAASLLTGVQLVLRHPAPQPAAAPAAASLVIQGGRLESATGAHL